jgi:sec-independent protein translocase protein TatA
MTPNQHLVPAFGMPAGMEWLVILIIALLLFGSKLPAVMRGLGGSIKEFKKGMDEGNPEKPKTEVPLVPEGAISRESKPVVESTPAAPEKK